jgi:hypothetical protein
VRRNNRNKADLRSRTADSHSCSTLRGRTRGRNTDKCASEKRAKGEAAERRAPPAASPAGISECGNCRGCDGGRRGESGDFLMTDVS